MYEDAKRHDVRLLLAAGAPQERIAELTGVSVQTIQRIGREPAGPASPGTSHLSWPRNTGCRSTMPSIWNWPRDMLRRLQHLTRLSLGPQMPKVFH